MTLGIQPEVLAEGIDFILAKLKEAQEPLTEDVLFLLLFKTLQARGSTVFQKVFHNVGHGGWNYWFAPDIDILEVRSDRTVAGYELKGFQKRKGRYEPPTLYAGLDQALAYLGLPWIIEPGEANAKFQGSLFNYVYLVHASEEHVMSAGITHMSEIIASCTPVGFIVANYERVEEVVTPKGNPFKSESIKKLFLEHLGVLEAYRRFKFKLVR